VPLRRKPARIALAGVTALVLLIGMVALLKGGGSDSKGNATAAATAARGIRDSEEGESFPEPASGDTTKVAEDPSQAALDAASAADSGPSPGAPSDAEVRKELRRLESWQRRARAGGAIGLGKHGLASAPAGSPTAVQDIVAGGNAIATFPYRLGGGHGSFVDSSYDCSGSVSYALAAAWRCRARRASSWTGAPRAAGAGSRSMRTRATCS
jgi:cell wall-associated NlpC family hydrolase